MGLNDYSSAATGWSSNDFHESRPKLSKAPPV
jgi:hypothetical protein